MCTAGSETSGLESDDEENDSEEGEEYEGGRPRQDRNQEASGALPPQQTASEALFHIVLRASAIDAALLARSQARYQASESCMPRCA